MRLHIFILGILGAGCAEEGATWTVEESDIEDSDEYNALAEGVAQDVFREYKKVITTAPFIVVTAIPSNIMATTSFNVTATTS